MRSIIVAFHDMDTAHRIRDVLLRHNLPVKAIATNASMALRNISSDDGGGLIVCGSHFSDMSSVNMLSLLPDDYDMLMLLSNKDMDFSFEHREGLYTLSLPVQAQDLASSARMLLDTRQLYTGSFRPSKSAAVSKAGEAGAVVRKQNEQRIIDQAKALLMNRNNMSEPEAHRFLQKKSMDSGSKLIDMAITVLKSQDN